MTTTNPNIGVTELPAVASNFYTLCKKCGTDRYHKVLTHKTATSAQIECEVCHSKKSFSLPKAGKTGAPKATGGRGAAAKAQAQARAVAKHEEQYNTSIAALESEKALDYKMSQKFQANQKVNHPKFGVGVVLTAFPQKVDIIFQDEVRSLVHNRQ